MKMKLHLNYGTNEKEWETSTLFEIKEFYIETRFKYVISVPSKLIGVRWQS